MKKIIVACGAGIATSTVALRKLQDGMEARGKANEVKFTQTSLAELPSTVSGHDLIVTTAQGGSGYGLPVISGLGLITGIGVDKVIDDVIKTLEL
ncbi:PTS sugar transporter subunit IIB [Desemzia incerta]|uniref:PTS sugar transporter subunit IIB n=1 Tax=Desemzia incerta TaxID=82801 RepID=UPI003D023B30